MGASFVARLESQIDYLETELSYLEHLLIQIGFSQGIQTLKETALELLHDSDQVRFQ